MSTITIEEVHQNRSHIIPSENTFERLVQDLGELLAQSIGTDFADIDPEPLIRRMRDYTSVSSDWSKYAHQNKEQCFTRNLIDKGNGRYNLLILVWSPGKESPIHDHSGSHCIMKMLQGSLREHAYDWPNENHLEEGKPSPLKCHEVSVSSKDEVTYISDRRGLHKITNGNSSEYAVSLHLYAPPNAAKYGCQIFDEETGHATHIVQYDLFSEMGIIRHSKNSQALAD